MKPAEHSISTNIQEPLCQITDVTQFFLTITEAYIHFQESILTLENQIPTSSPHQILEGCEKIRHQRNNLAFLDQQMIDVIALAGKEIIHEPIIHDYRIAFARASMACNNLYQNLKAFRCSLDEKASPLFSFSNSK